MAVIGVRREKAALSRSYGATGAVPLRFRLPNMNLTETGMSTSALAPAAEDEIATLFVGFELSKATWLIGLLAPKLGARSFRFAKRGLSAALKKGPRLVVLRLVRLWPLLLLTPYRRARAAD